MADKDFSQWTEQDIINFFLTTNDEKGMILPAVMKGLASVVPAAFLMAASDYLPSISTGLKTAALLFEGGYITYLACANVFTGQPKQVLNDHRFLKTLQNYYGNLKAGDDAARLNVSKTGALDYYNEAWKAADVLSTTYKPCFEKQPWPCALFRADALSYLGSINTSTGNFSAGDDNFKNALGFIDSTKQYDAFSIDRALEIEGFSLSNTLRNVESITSFIRDNGIQAHDEKVRPYLLQAEEGQHTASYSLQAGHGIIAFLSENSRPKRKARDAHFSLGKRIGTLLERNNDMKLNRALGKYYAIRGCYDFIQLGFKLGDRDTTIRETEGNITKGLEFLAKSYCNDSAMTVERYLNTPAFHSELQIALARNFTILYGLGRYTGDTALTEGQLNNLFRAYRKNNDGTELKKFTNSIYTAIEHILKPFGVPVETTDDLITRFSSLRV
jgi:hypothetical protein